MISRDEMLAWDTEELVSTWDALCEDGTCISLEEAGLEEEQDEVYFGAFSRYEWNPAGGVCELVSWFYDGESSEYETN